MQSTTLRYRWLSKCWLGGEALYRLNLGMGRKPFGPERSGGPATPLKAPHGVSKHSPHWYSACCRVCGEEHPEQRHLLSVVIDVNLL